MPTINISTKRLMEVTSLIDDLHDYFDKYADVDNGQPNDEMVFLDRLEYLDYIFNEKVK